MRRRYPLAGGAGHVGGGPSDKCGRDDGDGPARTAGSSETGQDCSTEGAWGGEGWIVMVGRVAEANKAPEAGKGRSALYISEALLCLKAVSSTGTL